MADIRVVSLVPSITETLRVWDVDPIACTRYCEQPDLPHVGGTKNPDIDAIAGLRPDVVLVDRQENRREDAEALAGRGVKVVAVDVRSMQGLDGELGIIAAAVGLPPPATVEPSGPPPPIERRAFIAIWRRPWMTVAAGTYGSSLLAAVGTGNVYDDAADDFPEVTLAEAAARRPDLVLAPSEPYTFTRSQLAELAAVAPVVEVDGRDLFWWGARTPAATERLRNRLARV